MFGLGAFRTYSKAIRSLQDDDDLEGPWNPNGTNRNSQKPALQGLQFRELERNTGSKFCDLRLSAINLKLPKHTENF